MDARPGSCSRLLWALGLIVVSAGVGLAPAAAQAADPHEAPPAETSAADASPPNPWAGTVELYGFVPWVQSTTTVRGFEAEADLGPGQILNLLQFAASARASVERERLGLLVDLAYNRVGAEQSRSTRRGLFTGTSEVTSASGVYDVALRYRFGQREAALGRPGDWSLIPYARVRVLQARLDVEAEVRGNGSLGLRYRNEGS
ncbi:MAG: hypothetical protein ACKO5M_07460 [Vulcanococcus sp.]